MRNLQRTLATAWETLNPPESSPKYLATFFAVAAALILSALLIGQM